MIIKIREGSLVELSKIKIVQAEYSIKSGWQMRISYFDTSINPDAYISCKDEKECYSLVDKLLEEINDSRKVKFI